MIEHIKPLPISEEMLGAYLEGNLSLEEARNVEQILQSNDELSAFVNELSMSDDLMSNNPMEDIPCFGNDFNLPETSTKIGTYIEPHISPWGLESSFADIAACAMISDITNDSSNYDLNFENNIANNNNLNELEANIISKEENFTSNDSFSDSGFSLDIDICDNEDLINDNYFDI